MRILSYIPILEFWFWFHKIHIWVIFFSRKADRYYIIENILLQQLGGYIFIGITYYPPVSPGTHNFYEDVRGKPVLFVFPFLCHLILFYHLDDSRIHLFPLMLDNRLCLDILFYVNLMDPLIQSADPDTLILFFFQYVLKCFPFHSLVFTLQRYPFFLLSIIFLLIIPISISSLCFRHNYFKHFLHASDLICNSVFLDSNLSVRFIRVLLKFSVCLLSSEHFFFLLFYHWVHIYGIHGFSLDNVFSFIMHNIEYSWRTSDFYPIFILS